MIRSIINNCPICGIAFKVTNSELKKGWGKFCSKKCVGVNQSKKEIGEGSRNWRGRTKINCKWCGVEMHLQPSRVGVKLFCNRQCYSKYKSKFYVGENNKSWKNLIIIKICKVCGKEYKTYKRLDNIRHTCSKSCNNIWQKSRTGDKNPAWRGGEKDVICKECGDKFSVTPSRIKPNRNIFCSQSCAAIYRIKHGNKSRTSIEVALEKEFKRRNIIFISQYPIPKARTIPDFFIEPNIVIYADGDYWHNRPEAIKKDMEQNYCLEFLGYKVYRFWEHEIKNNVKGCVDRIKGINGK